MLLTTAVILAVIATVVVLFMGIRSMAHGGASDRRHSGGLMSARVVFQAIAFVLIVLAIWLASV
jgi:hypothetical protein